MEENMSRNTGVLVAVLASVVFLGWTLPAASADEAVDKAFETLKTYDWGQDRAALGAVDAAVAASHDDEAAQKDLAARIAAGRGREVSGAAKDFVCRALGLVGAAGSGPG